jgi:hypothetical protein
MLLHPSRRPRALADPAVLLQLVAPALRGSQDGVPGRDAGRGGAFAADPEQPDDDVDVEDARLRQMSVEIVSSLATVSAVVGGGNVFVGRTCVMYGHNQRRLLDACWCVDNCSRRCTLPPCVALL